MVTATAVNPFPIYGKQADFRRSTAFIRGFVGGRGTGKTKIGSVDIQLDTKNGDSSMGVSPTYKDLFESAWPSFIETSKEIGSYVRDVASPIPRIIYRTRDGGKAEITFRTGERPDSLRGPNKGKLWIDEASIQHPDVWKWGLPVLRFKGRMGRATLTFTPKGTKHWTFGLFYEPLPASQQPDDNCEFINGRWYRKKPNTHLVHARSSENPFLPPEYVELIGQNYSSALAAQELEGLFVDVDGLMFRREWFKTIPAAPRRGYRIRYWDKAATDEIDNPDACYSAGVLMGWDQRSGEHWIEDVVRGQWNPLKRNEIIKETAQADYRKYGAEVLIYMEQEGGSGGPESSLMSRIDLAGFPVFIDKVSGKKNRIKEHQKLPGEAKVVRAQAWCAQAEAGNISLVEGPWIDDWLDEVCAFPEYAICDQVDATSGAFNMLHTKFGIVPTEAPKTAKPKPVNHRERWGIQFTRPDRRG